MLNFIIVSHKILEKYEKKLSGIISGILNEYKEKGIELNFKTIVDKIYSATENTIINSHIVNNLQFYFFNGPSENITSLRQSQLIMQIVLKYLPLDYQEIKIILLERMIFHILLEHNFDCNNFNRTVLMNDIIENIEYILNEKQELGIENDKLISQISVNFTLIEEDLIIALIESVQEYNNTILSVIISEISNKLLNTIPLEKFSCTISKKSNILIIKNYLLNLLQVEAQYYFSSKQNIFNFENIVINSLLLEYSKCVYGKGYNLNIQSTVEHKHADWHCLQKYIIYT